MTITINDCNFEKNYSQYEIQLKVVNFLQKEFSDNKIELFQVSVDDLEENVLEAYKNIENMNFIQR